MEYRTLKADSKAQIREKMSRFIAFAMPVADAEEAKRRIASVVNEYHDARHVCWAYQCGPEGEEWKLNDNGEPSGTAGRPILGQIRSAGITNVAVAVVRYFGGIKLGTSGLIAAYREAAREAIQAGVIVTAYVMQRLTVRYPYEVLHEVQRLLKSSEARITDQQIDMECTMSLSVRADQTEMLSGRLSSISGVSVTVND